jgi:hypothetical protein
MSRSDWSREEVEATVDDYLSMLASELAATRYNKTAHREALIPRLSGRTSTSIEFKHQNISAVLLNAGFPSINGYKPRFNYQALLETVVLERLQTNSTLLDLAASDADRPMVAPEVDSILSILQQRASDKSVTANGVNESSATIARKLSTNYLEREAANRSLGLAGEMLILDYERARLIHAGKESLAAKVEHTSQVRGDQEGYDILSFEQNGAERLIEVKTTKYVGETPFFITRNELSVSRNHSDQYHLYRLFTFREAPRLFTIPGAIDTTCNIAAATYLARLK